MGCNHHHLLNVNQPKSDLCWSKVTLRPDKVNTGSHSSLGISCSIQYNCTVIEHRGCCRKSANLKKKKYLKLYVPIHFKKGPLRPVCKIIIIYWTKNSYFPSV